MQPRTPRLRFKFAMAALGGLLAAASSPAHAAVDVLSAQSVKDQFVVEREGKTYLVVDRIEWELIIDPEDPALSRLGDGLFHPMSFSLVRDAITALDRVGRAVRGQVFILPYPRRANLKSSCEGGAIYLSPGIREVAPEHVHSTTAHEVGHLFQRSHAPEGSRAWEEYLDRRGLRGNRFSENAAHRDRPREIFAEDVRFLFGSALARTSGTIENPDLPIPTEVPGLEEWFDELARSPFSLAFPADERGVETFPNPFRPQDRTTIAFERSLEDAPPLGVPGASPHAVVVDLSGRRVRTLSGAAGAGARAMFQWDGRADDGAFVTAGVYFVQWLENPAAQSARVQLLR